jgi:hypothetical protein
VVAPDMLVELWTMARADDLSAAYFLA